MLGIRRGPDARAIVGTVLRELDIEVVPFSEALREDAFRGFMRVGKGRHPARLNLGDCVAYAFASHLGRPRRFKGDDFAQTDIGRVPQAHGPVGA